MNKEMADNLIGAIKKSLLDGEEPDIVAAFLVGQVVYLFQESGYTDDAIRNVLDNTLSHSAALTAKKMN